MLCVCAPQHINELSMKLDVEEILQKAEGICQQIKSCKVQSQSVTHHPLIVISIEVTQCIISTVQCWEGR